MNKKVVITLGAVLVAGLIGFGIYWNYSNNTHENENTDQIIETEIVESQEETDLDEQGSVVEHSETIEVEDETVVEPEVEVEAPTTGNTGSTKPAETKPAETKPTETKPAETKPSTSEVPGDTNGDGDLSDEEINAFFGSNNGFGSGRIDESTISPGNTNDGVIFK